MLDYILLGMLIYGEKSGYELKQTISRSTTYFFDASYGSIYPALKRLEAKGLIYTRETVEGGKFKKLHAISDSGRIAFVEWLEQPLELNRTRPDHLVPIFFYGLLPKEKRVPQLQGLIQQAEKVIEELWSIEERVKAADDPFAYAPLAFGLEYYPMVINWCRRLIEEAAAETQTEARPDAIRRECGKE